MTPALPSREPFEKVGLVELTQELVRIPSHPGIPRQEEAVVRALKDYFSEFGVTCELAEVAPGRPNLVARVRAEDSTGAAEAKGQSLLLCGHTDTVPLNETFASDDGGEPGVGFSGDIRDGRILGRGSVDMKGALAAMAAAVVLAKQEKLLARGELVFAAVVDEEMESLGAEALVHTGLRCDAALVGEPTSNRIALGHKGLEWLAVDFTGRAAHGGTPKQGVSAISAAATFLGLVEKRLLRRLAAREHPLLGPPTINAGTIRGGDQPSTVAAHCTIEFDRRTVPGESYETVLEELAELGFEVQSRFPGLRVEVRRMAGGMATMEHGPLEISATHPLVRALAGATYHATGRAAETCAFPAWTDGALLATFGGIPSAVLGPGDLAVAHSPREALPIRELFDAAAIYLETAIRFCAGVPADSPGDRNSARQSPSGDAQ